MLLLVDDVRGPLDLTNSSFLLSPASMIAALSTLVNAMVSFPARSLNNPNAQ